MFNILCCWLISVYVFFLQLADKDEYDHQLKDLEKVCTPIIVKLYERAWGMPDMTNMPWAGGRAGAPGGGTGGSGPTIEETDKEYYSQRFSDSSS